MDIIYNLFFYAIAFVLVIAALGVVFLPRIVYSAVSMILAFISVEFLLAASVSSQQLTSLLK